MQYRIRKAQNGEFYWLYFASNGKIIGRSSETYINKADCRHSIQLMKASHSAPVYEDA